MGRDLEARRDMLFRALASARRIELVETLQEQSGKVGVERLARTETDELGLYHHHLPRLADAGVVVYDKTAGAVERGPYFREAVAVAEMADEVFETGSR